MHLNSPRHRRPSRSPNLRPQILSLKQKTLVSSGSSCPLVSFRRLLKSEKLLRKPRRRILPQSSRPIIRQVEAPPRHYKNVHSCSRDSDSICMTPRLQIWQSRRSKPRKLHLSRWWGLLLVRILSTIAWSLVTRTRWMTTLLASRLDKVLTLRFISVFINATIRKLLSKSTWKKRWKICNAKSQWDVRLNWWKG